MEKRSLVTYPKDGMLMGNCRACGEQFKSGAPDQIDAQSELQRMFDGHTCVEKDASQTAVRIVREATENH